MITGGIVGVRERVIGGSLNTQPRLVLLWIRQRLSPHKGGRTREKLYTKVKGSTVTLTQYRDRQWLYLCFWFAKLFQSLAVG
jgi:hypothetical protein